MSPFLLYSTAINSIPSDDVDTATDLQSHDTPSQLTITKDGDTDTSSAYTPEVFLTAKTVHIRFLHLVSQLKQKFKDCDPQSILEACNKLTASTGTSHKAIPLLPYEYLEDLDNASTEIILNRLAFLWSWINHSVLRALLETCNCLEGIKMLDDFESQIDTDQPMELFPIPPPSIKMVPYLSSAYTVLSIRGEHHQNELVPLQYVNEVAIIMSVKFCVSPHALQLLAARASPLMLYWMIPKSIVPLVTKEVNKHLEFFKKNGFSEITVYPNTILFATDNLTLGSFALLSNQQVSDILIFIFESIALSWRWSPKPINQFYVSPNKDMVCVCVCACVRACVRVCVYP